MATRMSLIALGAILLAGCAVPSSPPALSADHPANPDAAAASAPAPSMTLAVNEPGGSASPADMPGMQHDMGAMQEGSGQMNHGASGAGPGTPDMPQAGHEGHGSGAPAEGPQAGTNQPGAAASSAAQTLYACPMHKDVTSTDPQDRCPKCKMKINKPLKQAAAPNAAPARGSTGHGGEHGGH